MRCVIGELYRCWLADLSLVSCLYAELSRLTLARKASQPNMLNYSFKRWLFAFHILSTPGEASLFFIAYKAQRAAYSRECLSLYSTFPNPRNLCMCVWTTRVGKPTCCPIWLAFGLIKAFVVPQTGCITISAPWSPVFMATWHYKQG